jgi:nicotinamidase-related amidase
MKNMAFMIFLFSLISCVSNNKKIGYYSNPQKALLVIDMQIDYIDENGKFPIEINQINNLVNITNEIIEYSHTNNYRIIYLRNVFRENDFRNRFRNYAVMEGTMGVEIDPKICILSENIFNKYTPSAFSNKDFEYFLINNQINELYLCGVMADECVYETALTAFNKGYIVNCYGNAVGSSSIKNIEIAITKLKNKGINIIKY